MDTPDPAPPAVSTNGGGVRAAVRATPLARRMATVHGVDLDTLEGTGPRGRITRADVAASAGIEDPGGTATARPETIRRSVPLSGTHLRMTLLTPTSSPASSS